jgi:hypothetical protein
MIDLSKSVLELGDVNKLLFGSFCSMGVEGGGEDIVRLLLPPLLLLLLPLLLPPLMAAIAAIFSARDL